MAKIMKGLKVSLMAGMVTLIGSPAFARGITLKDGGTALWVFIIIGAIIILLQLIPAAILFLSFIGKMTAIAFNKGERTEKVVLPGVEPVPAKK